jgi:hypothetical protein
MCLACWAAVWSVSFWGRPDLLHAAVLASTPVVLACAWLRGGLRRAFVIVTAVAISAGGLGQVVAIRLTTPDPPALFAHDPDAEPALASLPSVDAAMVLRDVRLLTLRRFATRHPGARLFAAPLGAPAYFLAMPPAVSTALTYEPSVGYDVERDYARLFDELTRRPPEVVMFTTTSAAAAFLHPPAGGFASVQRLAAFFEANYVAWQQLASTTMWVRKDLPEAHDAMKDNANEGTP